jgi:hypothetical protein
MIDGRQARHVVEQKECMIFSFPIQKGMRISLGFWDVETK